jgi:hypothetical protein
MFLGEQQAEAWSVSHAGPRLKYSIICLEKCTKEIRSVGIQNEFRTLPECWIDNRNILFSTISHMLLMNIDMATKWIG